MAIGISTFSRFLYLNIYAFLLLVIGVGIFVLPLYHHWWGLTIQIIWFIGCLTESGKIFYSWKDKERKYTILMERNTPVFRPDTCAEYMKAPCGRLLVRIVLKDLQQENQYVALKQYQPSLKQLLQESCTESKTTIYINPKYNKS
ncbi:MAG: hypothetical protein KBS70_06015 [Bacteroidales bacterium]|nr:hypothetical protein [Candidatus Colicola equi]